MPATDSLTQALNGPVEQVAQRLLGCLLVRELDGQEVICRIVETEAYHQSDAASHSYKGRTPRTDVMFGPPGHLYVYFTYGMHYCCNIVTGPAGEGSAVLIRAVEPIEGLDIMRQHRPKASGKELTNGPAKLCQALDINKLLNGHNLNQKPLKLQLKSPVKPADIVQTTRIGISQAKDVQWRFYLRSSHYVSKL
ncbi:MAG: DNA-3-methyladenine glycosylase [Candidatus Saccharibacteria bacterium]|nr:DNA-3-methyladenine glycosylase [Candidatus Saccharibacteria bacterium]